MTDRIAHPNDENSPEPHESDASLRPIPDGGLGAAMPDWLQQPPAWKRGPGQVPRDAIPAPDTSVIDPRQMLAVDDLPGWLQEIAGRRIDDELDIPAQTEVVRSASPLDTKFEAATQEVPVPLHLPNERPLVQTRSADPPQHWWVSDSAIGAIFIAIIITILYVVLVASNVL